MTSYESVPTDVLRNMIDHSRTQLGVWGRHAAEYRKKLESSEKLANSHRDDLREQEAEMRSREPEFGGTYQHPAGFAYQSFRGATQWEYRIVGTPVFVREIVVKDFGMCHESLCSEHGTVGGLAQSALADELLFAYRHFARVHV